MDPHTAVGVAGVSQVRGIDVFDKKVSVSCCIHVYCQIQADTEKHKVYNKTDLYLLCMLCTGVA